MRDAIHRIPWVYRKCLACRRTAVEHRGRMPCSLLSILAVICMVLAPFIPAQRLYICSITGQVQATCCCQAPPQGHAAQRDTSGCCTVVTVAQFLAPGHSQPALPADAAAPVALDLPDPRVVAVLAWPEPWPAQRYRMPPPRQRGPLFIVYCASLT